MVILYNIKKKVEAMRHKVEFIKRISLQLIQLELAIMIRKCTAYHMRLIIGLVVTSQKTTFFEKVKIS